MILPQFATSADVDLLRPAEVLEPMLVVLRRRLRQEMVRYASDQAFRFDPRAVRFVWEDRPPRSVCIAVWWPQSSVVELHGGPADGSSVPLELGPDEPPPANIRVPLSADVQVGSDDFATYRLAGINDRTQCWAYTSS